MKYSKLLRRVLSRRLNTYPARLFVITIVLIASFLAIQKLRSENENPTILTASDTFLNSSTSCHLQTINGYLERLNEHRCYPLLINFAHGCCKREQKNNCLTGLQYGVRQCAMFNKRVFNNYPAFVNRNKNILQRKRGAGYWLWKPFIIFQELYYARDGDIIIYSDALVDFVANISYFVKLTEEQDIIVFRLTGTKESTWTKRDGFILLDVDKPQYTDTPASLASYLVVKKSFTSMAFISEWLTYAQDSRAITDDENTLGLPNYSDFRDHRHDQSILSLLVKKWNLTVYPDPSQWGESEKRPYPTIFNHHRSQNSFLNFWQ